MEASMNNSTELCENKNFQGYSVDILAQATRALRFSGRGYAPPRAAGEALGGGEALWRPHLQSPERGAALARLEKRPRSRGHS